MNIQNLKITETRSTTFDQTPEYYPKAFWIRHGFSTTAAFHPDARDEDYDPTQEGEGEEAESAHITSPKVKTLPPQAHTPPTPVTEATHRAILHKSNAYETIIHKSNAYETILHKSNTYENSEDSLESPESHENPQIEVSYTSPQGIPP